nr:MAG: replication initiation protein [Microvirus Sku28]
MKITDTLSAPFTGCLEPRVIVNSVGDKMLVPCGHCIACTLRKSNTYTSLCRLESLSHPQTWFITLTLNDDYIPRLDITFDEDNLQCRYKIVRKKLVKTDSKDSADGYYHIKTFPSLFALHKYKESVVELQKKVGNEYIPVLYKKDLQRFLYKLRNYFKKLGYGKLRYFAVGEYGPEHLRPHYHLLLWLETPLEDLYDYSIRTHGRNRIFTSSNVLDKGIRACWKYGYQTSELSKGHAAQYTSGYATSYNYVPFLLRESKFRPFQCHSNGLGKRFFDTQRDSIYENGGFNNMYARFSGNYSEIIPSVGIQTAFFPKCYGYSTFAYEMRFALYTLYDTCAEIYKAGKVSEISKEIFTDLYDLVLSQKNYITRESTWYYNNDYEVIYGYDPSVYRDVPTSIPCDRVGLLRFLLKFLELNNLDIDRDSQFLYDFICRQLRTSKHFLEFCCSSDRSKVRSVLSKIDSYYKAKSLKQLNDSYAFQEKYSDFLESDLLECMYDDTFDIDLYKRTRIYKLYHSKTGEKFDNRIKHKKVNDKFNILKH